MDEQELNEQQQAQAEHDSSKKLVKEGAKAAANAYAGPVGGQVAEAVSNTTLGDKVLDTGADIAQKAGLGKMAKAADDAGLADALGTANGMAAGMPNGNMSSGGLSTNHGMHGRAGGLAKTGGLPMGAGLDSGVDSSGESETDNNENIDVSSSGTTSTSFNITALFGSNIKVMAIGAFSLLFLIILVLVVIASAFLGIFESSDAASLKKEYYETLSEVQAEFNKEYGVCIDTNLITASLTVTNPFDEVLNDPENNEVINGSEDVETDDGQIVSYDYKLMKKQIRLLARMQLVNATYKLDKEYYQQYGTYCSQEKNEIIPVDSFNSSSLSGVADSSTMEKIASNDRTGWTNIFVSKVNEEMNYAYYLYRPYSDQMECSEDKAKDLLPKDKVELSIGTYETNTESVYYWNLVNQFIGYYYEDYLPSAIHKPVERQEKIKKIADEIYLLYEQLGPSQTCTVAYSGPSSLCPNGITIEGVGTLDFEEYIAGVVSREAYTSEGMEALKAQAVAARTYALNYTNYCEKVIPNSTNAQTFTQNINDRARQAARETAGEVLVNKDGNIFSAQYDSFCYQDEDCPDAVENPDGTFSVTYTKAPYGEKHIITLSDPKYYKWMVYPNKGHGRGMSQLVSYQLAAEGKTYQEILSYFYSEGVEIKLVVSPNNTEGATIIKAPITNYLDVLAMNQYIYTQVNKAGVGTREGVVTAAVSLISGIYNQTGFKLPYELKPSGKYTGYGMDSSWGTNTGNSSYPLNGLDCSGFISWSMHNGGYKYEGINAKGWGNSGNKRKWFKGTTDSSALPGDLIYNEPPNENGTSGHIRMIVEVTTDGYVIAEASSGKNGVRIKTIPFTSSGSYYLVDMSEYYANTTKVTDYPS